MAATETNPLAGKRIVVSRAPEQAHDLIQALRELGAEVLLLPAIHFSEPPDTERLDAAIRELAGFDWILFTSRNAVRFFAQRCRKFGMIPQGRKQAGRRGFVTAAVGPATAQAATEEGFAPEFIAREFRGEALAQQLGPQLAGKRVLLPRSDRAGTGLPEALRAHGAEVVDVVAYHTHMPESLDASVIEAIRQGQADVLTFASPSAFSHVAEQIGLDTLRRIAGSTALAAIGPVTAAAIRDAGLTPAIEAGEATSAALVAAIRDYFAEQLASGAKPK